MEEKIEFLNIDVTDEIVNILDKISIFGGIDKEQIRLVFKHLKLVKFKKDNYIFKQGEAPKYIYIMIKGTVKLVTEIDQMPFELIEYGVGSSIGETALIGIQKHSASAYVTQDCECLVLSRGALLSLYKSDKDIFGLMILNIARDACRKLSHTEDVALHYSLKKK